MTGLKYALRQIQNKLEEDNITTEYAVFHFPFQVVMVKEDIDLDMKGRCSAGQKVLVFLLHRFLLRLSYDWRLQKPFVSIVEFLLWMSLLQI